MTKLLFFPLLFVSEIIILLKVKLNVKACPTETSTLTFLFFLTDFAFVIYNLVTYLVAIFLLNCFSFTFSSSRVIFCFLTS